MSGSRTRVLLALVALVTGAALVDRVVLPTIEHRERLSGEVDDARATLRMVNEAVPLLAADGALPLGADPVSGTLAERVEASLQRFGLNERVARIAPVGELVEVNVEAVRLDRLLAWVAWCETRLGMRTNRMRLSRGSVSGVVSGSLALGESSSS